MAAKRRRERDRPKAANDAPYNPNKRVLLSYGSDEEQVEDEALEQLPQGHPQAETDLANYKIDEYADDEEEELELEALSGSGKPEQNEELRDSAREVAPEPAPKATKAKWSRPVSKNEATGQWPALGSLKYQWDEDCEDEDEGSEEHTGPDPEAMAYLRAVRSERQNLPEVFTVAARDGDEDIYWKCLDDARGFVDDGAYVGRPVVSAGNPRTYIDPQEAFTTALKKRFLALRQELHSKAGVEDLAMQCIGRPIEFYEGNNKLYAQWLRSLRVTTPLPAQVKSLSQESIFGLLAMLQRHYLARGKHISANTSIWIWSLLARLDDAGNMNNDQVYQVREFGKDALLVQISFHNPAAAAQLDAHEPEQQHSSSLINAQHDAAADGAEIELDLDDAIDDTAVKESEPDADIVKKQQTLATLEMILAIVGDVFGQRDLLDFRRPWEADAAETTLNEVKSC